MPPPPHTHDRTTKLATSDRSRETILADGDLLIDDFVCKTILSTCHGSDKDGNRVSFRQGGDVLREFDRFRIGRES
jgi:hypothetical protein